MLINFELKRRLKKSQMTERDFAISENERIIKSLQRGLITEEEAKDFYNQLVDLLKR